MGNTNSAINTIGMFTSPSGIANKIVENRVRTQKNKNVHGFASRAAGNAIVRMNQDVSSRVLKVSKAGLDILF
jgi:hypothetical protein